MELAAVAIAVIATAIMAMAAPALNALARAAMAPALELAMAASTGVVLAAPNAAMVLDPRGKWTPMLKIWDKVTNWLWALVKALMAKKLLAAVAAKVKVLEPAMATATIAVATTAKEQLLAKVPVLVPAKIAAAVRNPVPTRWNRQLVLNRTLLPLVQLREPLLEWVLEVRAL